MGTGTGVWAEVLTEYCDQVVGVDFAEENIWIAEASARESGLSDRLSYQLGDVQRLDGIPDVSFDVAVQISVLQHLPDKAACLTRIHQILNPGGALVLLVHNRDCVYNHNLRSQKKRGGQVSVNEYSTLADLRALLREAGFEVEEMRLTWLFLNDLIFLGSGRAVLRPLAPLRALAMHALAAVDAVLGRWRVCAPLFREIVVLARKES